MKLRLVQKGWALVSVILALEFLGLLDNNIGVAVVEQHGGSIGVYSEEGKGSTFWFSVPKKGS